MPLLPHLQPEKLDPSEDITQLMLSSLVHSTDEERRTILERNAITAEGTGPPDPATYALERERIAAIRRQVAVDSRKAGLELLADERSRRREIEAIERSLLAA